MDKKALIKSAYLAFKQGQFDKAVEDYQQLFQQDQSDIGVLCLVGDSMTRQGRLSDALKQYRRALVISKKSQNKLKTDVIQKKMIRIDPDSVADFELEYMAVPDSVGEETSEIRTLKQAIEKEPKNPELLKKAGQLLEAQKLFTDAAKYYLVLGNVLYSRKQYEDAAGLFKHILEFKPDYIQAHLALGEIYAKQGADSDAKKEFLYAAEQLIRNGDLERGQVFAQKAIQLKSIEAHYYLGIIFMQNSNIDEAKKEFETLMKFKVNHQGGLTLLALIHVKANQLTEALGFYERLLKVDAKNADALEAWAACALKQGNSEQAREKISMAIDTFAAQEQWERAAIAASQAIELDSENQEFYLKLAEVSYNAGLEEEAAETLITLASLMEANGQTQEAQQMRAKAQEITGGAPVEPTPPPVASSAPPPPPAPAQASVAPLPQEKKDGSDDLQMMMNIADTYIQQGSLDEAIDVYQKILKNDPHNEKVKSALTRVYAMFAGINPETAVARRSKSDENEKDGHQVQREARERAQREAQVRSQRKTSPGTTVSTNKNGQSSEGLLNSIGNDKEDEIAGDNQDEFMTVTVAEIYTKQGLLNEALKIYQKILEIEPGNQEAKLKKQELESKMQEQERLRRQSEKAVEEKAAAEKKAAEEKAAEEKAAAEKKAAEEKAAEERAAAEKKAAEEKAAEERAAAEKKAAEENKKDEKSTKPNKSNNDGQDPPPPKRRGRVSYV